jgi:hypothetical protein
VILLTTKAQTLYPEAGPAAATRRRLRVLDSEGRTPERFYEVDHTAGNEIKANRINHQLHSSGLADGIVFLCGIGQIEFVLKA